MLKKFALLSYFQKHYFKKKIIQLIRYILLKTKKYSFRKKTTMHSRRTAQDVERCKLCDISPPSMYCDICHIYLCKTCVGRHLLDVSIKHKVVPFNKRGSTPPCPKHSQNICELFCEQCNSIICAICVSSGEHEKHKKLDVWKKIDIIKSDLQKDIKELEEKILPNYEAIVANISVQKAAFETNSQKIKLDIAKKGEEWHKEIDNIINKLNSEVDELVSRHQTVLDEEEYDYSRMISIIKRNVSGLKHKKISNDFHRLSAYESRNSEFRKSPPVLTVSLPTFIAHQINKEQINQQFGFLSAFSTNKDDVRCFGEPHKAETI